MTLRAYTDGGALGNPGPGAYAYVIYQDNKLLTKHGQAMGYTTNNCAEYTALIMALEKIKTLSTTLHSAVERITVYSDSELMVRQLNGLYKVKNANMREFVMKIRILEQEIKIPIQYINIPREQNELADSLVKQALR